MRIFMGFTLEMAVEAFADWRETRKSKSEMMPELLIRMVKYLHPVHGSTVLRKSLGVNSSQLKRLGIIVDKSKTITPAPNKTDNEFAIATINSPTPNGELVLQKGNNSLTLKLPPQQLEAYLQTMAAFL